MATIMKTSMKDQAYQVIKDKIFKQEYDFGDTINITSLSKELGISNTPIREALSRLEAEGLVELTLSTKVQVISFNSTLFNEISRSFFVQVYGAYGLCHAAGKLDYLTVLMDEALAEQQRAFDAGDPAAFIVKAIAFDRIFVVATGNQRMLKIYDGLAPMLYLLTRYNHQEQDDNRAQNLAQHKAIREAAAKGELEEVERLMMLHFDKHF